jgi:hypothetical protein
MINKRESNTGSVIQLLVVLFIVLSGQMVHAQKYSLGIRGGGSITWPSFGDKEAKDVFNRGLKPGFHAGVFIGFPLKDHYDVLIEAGVSQKGRILTFNENHDWHNSLTMRMADMGMMLRRSFKFMLNKNTPAEGFVNLGPEINYWISSKGYLKVGEGPKYRYQGVFEDEPDADNGYSYRMREVNRWLFSLGVGFGVKMPLHQRQHLTTEFRFLSGHTFLGKPHSTGPESGPGNIIWGDGNMQDTMKTNLKTLNITLAYTLDFDVIQSRKGKSTIKKRLKRS